MLGQSSNSCVRAIIKFAQTGFLAALAICILVLSGCSQARGQYSNVKCAPDTGLINGELDWGIKVTATVKNVGQAGLIDVSPILSTSEGDWRRNQSLQFEKGESMELSYFFHEPTINTAIKSVQCRMTVFPAAQ